MLGLNLQNHKEAFLSISLLILVILQPALPIVLILLEGVNGGDLSSMFLHGSNIAGILFILLSTIYVALAFAAFVKRTFLLAGAMTCSYFFVKYFVFLQGFTALHRKFQLIDGHYLFPSWIDNILFGLVDFSLVLPASLIIGGLIVWYHFVRKKAG